jgi:hypothetical protein
MTGLFFLLLGISPAHADDIVFSLGSGDGVSVEDTLPFELLRVDDSGTLVKLKGGDTFRIQDNTATELLRLEDDGNLYKSVAASRFIPSIRPLRRTSNMDVIPEHLWNRVETDEPETA